MRRGFWVAAFLTLFAVSAGAQHATVPSRGGTVTSGNATSGFTANTLIWNGSSVLGSGPKFLSGNLSLEIGTNYCSDSGANDTYVCTLAGGSLSAYSTGTKITLKANTANTGTATVAVDGLAAITITRRDDSTLQTGDITAGEAVELVYDGNTFRLQGGLTSVSEYAAGGLTFPAGSAAAAPISKTGTPTYGMYFDATGNPAFTTGGTFAGAFKTYGPGRGLMVGITGALGFSSSTSDAGGAYSFFMQDGVTEGAIRMGANANGAVVNQLFKACDGVTGTNISGCDMRLAPGRSTGTGAGGVLYLQSAPLEASGTTAQTLVDRAMVPKTGGFTILTGTKPTCDAATRGNLFYVAGGAGVADTIEICGKPASDVYAWYPMATIP